MLALPFQLITIIGPTASGKTKLAVQLAAHIGGEIISADSRQVYKGMDIGTGKDLNEYFYEGKHIPYHLIDIVEAGESYHLYQFQQDFQRAFDAIRQRGNIAILCGGSGLYVESVLKGFQYTAVPIDESLRERLAPLTHEALKQYFYQIPSQYTAYADVSTHKRCIRAIEISTFLRQNPTFELPTQSTLSNIIFGLNPPVELRRERITQRLHQRLAEGMIQEVAHLLESGISAQKLNFYGLEYKFVTAYLQGEMPYEAMVEKLNIAIHQFAKRQMTYFRKMEKDGLAIHWLENEPFTKLINFLEEISLK